MSVQTINHLVSKYGVPSLIIKQLHGRSLAYQAATTDKAKRAAMASYNRIVRTHCGGIDPLV